MMWNRMVGVVCVLSLLPLAAPALAGQGGANPAGITGVVTDNSGAVLPGVTVTATSPALQVPSVISVSDARGEYRLSPLSIGLYTVLFELAGFQNVRREGVRLTVGFTARVDAEMNVGAVSETITVSGASPLVDTTSTATSTELTQDQVEVLPTSRDGVRAFMSQVPGVRSNLEVGASALGDGVQYRVYGQTGGQWQMLDGLLMNRMHIDFYAMDGTRVETVGANAEMPSRGMLVDTVLKSGGNEFHGDAVVYGSGGKLEGDNIDATLARSGIRLAKLHTLRDFSVTMGGRIIRNKLWFFGGGRRNRTSREILDAFDPDGTPILNVKMAPFYLGKVSYQASPANRLNGLFHSFTDYELRDASRFIPRSAMLEVEAPHKPWKVEWQTVRGDALVASVQFGQMTVGGFRRGFGPGQVSTIDIGTLFVTGDLFAFNGNTEDEVRNHTKGVVSYYKSDLLGGKHEFKAGFDHLGETYFNGTVINANDGDDDFNLGLGSGNKLAYQLRFNNGVPFQLATQNTPVRALTKSGYLGLYAQDSWTLARRLTLNLGLRVEHQTAHAPGQCRGAGPFAAAQCWDEIRLVDFNSIAPRAHVAFDVTGDGKTGLKGGYGRFNQIRDTLGVDLANINQNVIATTIWDWHDNNGNKLYEPGEVNLDRNGPDFRSISGTGLGIVNPNEKQPKSDEFSLTFERELLANTAVRVTGVYARNFNVYTRSEISRDGTYTTPITNLDPGPDGRLGTADDPGRAITYYDYPTSLGGAAFAQTMMTNDPSAEATYKTFEIAGTKRPSNNWQLSAAYSGTWINIPFTCGTSGTGIATTVVTVSRCLLDPNTTFNSGNHTLEWGAKLSGAYTLPFGILAAANYDIRSGAPQARQVLFTGGTAIRSIALNVDPLGTFSLPATHLVDVRAAKKVNLGGGRAVELRADLFNVLNRGTVLAQTLLSGANYLRASRILPPRILQVGARFTF